MENAYDISTVSTMPVDVSGIIAMISAIVIPLAIISLICYIYMSWATMTIANKLKVPNGWLAFIPIANLYLWTQIADVPWWTFLLVFAAGIPFIGWYFLIPAIPAIMAWWYIRAAKRRGFDEMMGIWMFVPLVNFVIIGILAWSEAPKKNS